MTDAYVMPAVYCPRCDKRFVSQTREAAMADLDKHVLEAHPEYQNWEDED